jgi:hypothetical protein
MATDYEKVCPACGNAAPLASKFCSGCGHEYRTVFHEQSEPMAAAAVAVPSSGADMNWVPLATVIPVLAVLLWWAFQKAPVAPVVTVPAPATVATLPAQYASNLPQANLLKYGETPGDVLQAIGKPQKTENMINGSTTETNWYYVQGTYTLQVHFNANQQVDSWRTY